MADFSHVETWIFDLDNTLYPSKCNLFSQIDVRMTQFVIDRLGLPHDEARRLQKAYYVDYGTTLNGLMHEHKVRPDDFLDYVHDIDVSALAPSDTLARLLKSLPGRRYVYTNGSVRHAENVMARLGVADLFDDIFDIAAADYTPKPQRESYEKFLRDHGVVAPTSAMFEDLPQNLEAPHALGMTTVLVRSPEPWIDDEPEVKRPAAPGDDYDHVHHVIDDLVEFLGRIRTAEGSTNGK